MPPRFLHFLRLAGLLLSTLPAAFAASVQTIVTYPSTVSTDANGPLDLTVELNYDDSRSSAPIAVVMHQYSDTSGNFDSYRPNAHRLRDAGFFVLTVAMRGRDGSDGVRDSGGVEIYDIYDAIEHVKTNYAARVNASSVYITGYSGGGGNVFSAITKFPDYFRAASAFFGMSDYGFDPVNGWYQNGAGARTSILNADIGNRNTGGPAVLDRYHARASNLAAKNNPYSEIHLFVNTNETICPPVNSTSYRDYAVAAESAPGEFANITVHLGSAGTYHDFNGNGTNEPEEQQSWPHQAPTAAQQSAGEAWFLDRLLAGTIPEPVLLASDELFVAGFVKTKRFALWLGDGQNAAASLTYSLSPAMKQFALNIASNDQTVTGKLTVDTSDFTTANLEVRVNGTLLYVVPREPTYQFAALAHGNVLTLHPTDAPVTVDHTIGYWRFESASGFLADSSANGLTLSTQGTAPTASTLPATGAGAAFDDPIPRTGAANAGAASVSGGNFTRADAPALAVGNFTIEAYARRTANPTSTQYIASHWLISGSQRSWGFGVAGSSPPAGLVSGELFLTLSATGTSGVVVGSGLLVPLDTDFHLAASLDFGDAAAGFKFYRKNLGTGEVTIATKSPPVASLHNSTGSFNIGSYDSGANRWTGLLDEVRLSGTALPESALLTHSAGPPTAGTPVILPTERAHLGPVDVTMSSASAGATIRYTLDGSVPEETSPAYTAPLRLEANATVKARAFHPDLPSSAVASASFTVAGFTFLGNVQPRAAAEITSSNWSVGCETLDRDFAIYANYKSYLGPLGAKKARFQAGWAKTEQTPGVYDWAWLDFIINDAVAQGVKPWLQPSYGNLIYTGGGGPNLGDGIPTSATALAAWDAWVHALVTRYQDRVAEWEIWNEPDIGSTTATAYADFFVRTAEIVRAVQPSAKILALGMAGLSSGSGSYLDTFLARVQTLGKLHLIDQVTYHGYPTNPDSNYSSVQGIRNRIAIYSSTITARQGENGAPSTLGSFGALGSHPFTELTQAKWDLRRMLGDLGRDLESNVFTLMDLQYTSGLNTKGLLKSNPDKTVAYAKPAYFAVQHVTSIFDDSLTRIPNYSFTSTAVSSLSVFGYAKTGTSRQVVTVWFNGATPSDSNARTAVDFTFSAGDFVDPVYIDLREGKIFDIPAANWSQQGATFTFTGIPCYDSPILIADKSALLLPVDQWKRLHFTSTQLATPGVTGFLDDAEQDGRRNLEEYVLGSDPNDPAQRGTLTAAPMTVGAGEYLTLTYSRSRNALDVRIVPEVSSDLITWLSGPEHLTEMAVSPQGSFDLVTVRDNQPIQPDRRRFLRLQIELP